MEEIQYNFFCNNCNFKCKYQSSWIAHINTSLHQTGKKKTRSDYKGPAKCDKCNFSTNNSINYKKHILNTHSTKEDRETHFKFYCKLCDFGTFAIATINLHNNTDKHKNFETIFNKK
jgi:hypothetical protein